MKKARRLVGNFEIPKPIPYPVPEINAPQLVKAVATALDIAERPLVETLRGLHTSIREIRADYELALCATTEDALIAFHEKGDSLADETLDYIHALLVKLDRAEGRLVGRQHQP